ncbi:Rho termination factor N-terminal domain-containing protein [Paenibacillus polymyxa]|uniref:Rho termination factor N-terminal domain-containing protein n=1 Tax=Paenibacillus TaxID=44249 RepID=UPI002024A1A9|nr:Rho termination factor N-terminal domain-containing protein [Paenibacillus polymyxa]URJ42152.1 Rho termination factor N-terminal domain-containing protein [Paenibacillus polymyxa]
MKVTLTNSAKYGGEFYIKGQEIEVDPKHVLGLIADRVISSDTEVPEVPGETDINKMNLAQLKDYAEQNSIDLAGATKKEDVLAAILKAGEGNGTEPQGSAADQV